MESIVGHIGATWRARLKLCTLAPPGEYDWTCASLGPPKPKRQIDRFSGFCTSSRQKVPIFTMGVPFIQNCPFPLGDLDPMNFVIPWTSPSPQPKRHLDRFSRFCTDDRGVCLHFTMGHPFSPQNCPFPWGDLDPNLIHGSLGPPESSFQTASRSVQPFLYGLLVWQTDRPTDHATRSVT